VRMTIMCFI